MIVRHLSLTDFRNYETADVTLVPGVNLFIGSNGQGKTNLVEAIGYLSTLGCELMWSTMSAPSWSSCR